MDKEKKTFKELYLRHILLKTSYEFLRIRVRLLRYVLKLLRIYLSNRSPATAAGACRLMINNALFSLAFLDLMVQACIYADNERVL